MAHLAEPAGLCESLIGTVRGGRPLDVEPGHEADLAAGRRVLDVDAVVLAIRPGDPEEHQRPPKDPDPALLGQRPFEFEPAGAQDVVVALVLLDAVHPDTQRGPRATRKIHDPTLLRFPSAG